MPKWYGYLLPVALCSLMSCSKLQYIDQALAVKAYSDEQEAIGREVSRSDARFDALLAEVRTGRALAEAKTTSELVRRFGPPVLKMDPRGAAPARWLYRYQVKRQGPKVYVSIHSDGGIGGFALEE